MIRALTWFGVAGGALAWTVHLVSGYFVDTYACAPGTATDDYWGVGVKTVIVVLTVLLGAVAAAALGGSAYAWRALKAERGPADPRGRLEFLAHSAALVDVLFLTMIVLGGLQLLELSPCRQG